MVSAQHTTFSAAQRTHHSPTVVVPSESDSAAEQFVNVLDQLLGKNTKVKKADSFEDLNVAPAEMLYREKEEATPLKPQENCEAQVEDSKQEATEAKEAAVVDSSTVSLLIQREKGETKQTEKVATEIKQQAATGGENKAETKGNSTAQAIALSAQKQAVSEAFKLVKQAQVAQHKTEAAQPLEQLQANLENYFKTQPDQAQTAAKSPKTGQESELQIEKIFDVKADSKAFMAADTRPHALKSNALLSPTVIMPNITAGQAEKYSAELAKLATRGALGTKLIQEMGRDREPIASLSLLGEKSKVQNSKDSGKSHQLTSRQEQIINQILKQIEQAAKLKDGSTLSIRIKPEELGEVLVKVSQRGDQLFARIVPENKEVEHTVRKGINEVIAQLVAAGFKPDNIHVSIGKELSESESFSAFHSGQPNPGQDKQLDQQNLLGRGDGHGSGLSNPHERGSKSDSKKAFSTLKGAVDNGWVA